MSYTSVLKGRLAYDDGDLVGAAQVPIGAVIARRVVLNNLLHYADAFGQTRVAWSIPINTYSGGNAYLRPRSSPAPVADEFYEIASFGQFPLQLRADGTPYKIALWATGYSSSGDEVTFRIAVCPSAQARDVIREAADHVWEASTTSTASAALSGATLGTNAYTTLLAPTAARAALWRVPTGTLVDLGGAPAGVEQTLVSICVWASTANTGSYPALTGLYAREWIG